MSEALWFAGLAVANLWLAGSLGYTSNTEKVMPGGARFDVAVGGVAGMPPLTSERTNGVRPSTAEVLQALPKATSIPQLYDVSRDDIQITTEKIVDRVDPVRFFPMVGPAQLHHCHWKCSVHFTETVAVAYPFPMKTQSKRVEIVYIDKDRLLPCVAQEKLGGVCAEPSSGTDVKLDVYFQSNVQMADDPLAPNRKIPGLKASVTLVSTTSKKTMTADGTITVEMYHQDPAALGKPQLLSVWTFDAATLKTLRCAWYKTPELQSPVQGCSYDLFLPCDPQAAHVKKVKLEVKYTPNAGRCAFAQSAVLDLRYVEPSLARVGQTEESAAPPANGASTTSSLSCLERLAGAFGFINQYSSDPLVRMEEQLIDSENLRQMHDEWRRFWMNDQPAHMTPYRVPGGVGTASSSITAQPREAPKYRVADRIHVVAAPQVVPAPTKPASTSATQVQIEAVLAHVDQAAWGLLPLTGDGCDTNRCEVLVSKEKMMAVLQALRSKGKAKILAEPRLLTASGRPAIFVSGAEMPILVTGGERVRLVEYKQIGTTINVMPTVQATGKIHLRIIAEFAEPAVELNRRGADEVTFDAAHMETTLAINDGETLVFAGKSLRVKGRENHLLLLTARVIQPVCCDAKPATTMTLTDVARLAQRGISEDIIFRQMDLTGATFRLTVEDILSLHEQGVSENIIRVIQMRAMGAR